jgi:hypothetical protein
MSPYAYPTAPTARAPYRAHVIRCLNSGARPLNFERFRSTMRTAFFSQFKG